MKKTWRKVVVAMTVAILTLGVVGACSNNAVKTPKQVIELYLNHFIKNESEALTEYTGKTLEQLGVDKNVMIADAAQEMEGSDLASEQATAVWNGIFETLSKVEYTVGAEVITDNTATVTIDVKGVDFLAFTKEISDLVMKDMTQTNAEESKKMVYQYFLDNLDKLKIVEQPKTATITLEKQNDVWQIIDASEIDKMMMVLLVLE